MSVRSPVWRLTLAALVSSLLGCVATDPSGHAEGEVGNVSAAESTCTFSEKIAAKYTERGEATGPLGACVAGESATTCGNAVFNRFQNGSITAVNSSGAVLVTQGALDKKWNDLGGACGELGLPLADEEVSACGKGPRHRFENGVVIAGANGAHAVQGGIAAKWAQLNAECGFLGLPVTDELTPSCGVGRYSDFEGGGISYSPQTGAQMTMGAIRQKYLEVNRECGLLGFPTTDEAATRCGGGRYNHFQNGAIVWTPATGAHISVGAIRNAYAALDWDCGPLGFPTTDEVPTPYGVRQDYQGGFAMWHAASGRVDAITYPSPSLGISAFGAPLSPGNGGTYPRAVALKNGEFLAAFDSGAPGRLVLRTSVSNDQGWSWTDRGVIADEPANNNRTLGNVFLFQLPTGRVLAAFRHHDQIGAATNYRLLVSGSDDNGRTWFFVGAIETGGTKIWEPFLFLAPDNSLQAYYAREKPNGNQDIVMRRSFDGGASWGGLVLVASQSGSRDGMPGVARLNDNSLIVIFESFRTPNNPKFVVRTVQSTDSGNTWNRRRDVYVPGNGSRNAGSPDIRALPDGRLVASFMSDEDSGPLDWPNHAAVKLLITDGAASVDNVRWRYPAAVAAPAAAYWPGLTIGPTGEGFVLFDQGGPKLKRIVPR